MTSKFNLSSDVCQPVGGGTYPPSLAAQLASSSSTQDKRNSNSSNAPNNSNNNNNNKNNLKRKCIDFHNPAVIELSSRLYRKSLRSQFQRMDAPYIQPHSSYIRLMGLPISSSSLPNPSFVYCTQMAHVTRAKNSNPVM